MQQLLLERRIGGQAEGQLTLGPYQAAGALDEAAAQRIEPLECPEGRAFLEGRAARRVSHHL